MDNVRDAAIRAIRTFLQTFLGLLLVQWTDIVDIKSGLSVLATAAMAAAPAVISFLQNVLEDNTDIPTVK